MSEDVKVQVNDKLKLVDNFMLQLGESTDIPRKPKVVTFMRFIYNQSIIEQFLFCKKNYLRLQYEVVSLKCKDIFNLVNNYFKNSGLSYESCCLVEVSAQIGQHDL